MKNSRTGLIVSLFGILVCPPLSAQVTQRASVATGGAEGDLDSEFPSISADGRYVAFESAATGLVAGDTNGRRDIFVRDRAAGTTVRVSVATGGAEGDSASLFPSISADGRYVAFHSGATNLVAGDTNAALDVFVHDRQTGTTERVSVDSGGVEGDLDSSSASVSADGRYVAFQSSASNLVASDTNNVSDVFVRDRQAGTTERVSIDSGGTTEGDRESIAPSISADGTRVAFTSFASSLVTGDANGFYDVFVRDRQAGTTERVSLGSGGGEGDNDSGSASISGDGRFVGFHSLASNFVAGDTNVTYDVFVHDRQSATTERVSLDSGGAQGNDESRYPSISADGRFVGFESLASNLVAGDTNSAADTFVHDRQAATTERVSLDSAGNEATGNTGSLSQSISADGRFVAFASSASNLVASDTNGVPDVFLRDRDQTGFTSLCDPGVAGVQSCPCSNPPSGSGRGCNNSSATGGASLTAAGMAYLSMDSLVFTTSGQRPTALSILLQGTTSPPAGIIYGQGIRCVAGSLKRLFNKAAVGGSITAPDFGAGDPTVSARSAAKGDVISAGQNRWYLVFYRDPTVLGGCPATSTFNATQTGRIAWSM